MSEDTGHEGFELSANGRKIKVWGDSIANWLTLLMVCLLAYGGLKHDADAAKQDAEIIKAVNAQTVVQKEQLDAARESNCLARLTPEQKKQEKEIDFCRSLGKGRDGR